MLNSRTNKLYIHKLHRLYNGVLSHFNSFLSILKKLGMKYLKNILLSIQRFLRFNQTHLGNDIRFAPHFSQTIIFFT